MFSAPIVLVLVVVFGLPAVKKSRTKDDDEDEHDCRNTLQSPDRPRPRRRPRFAGGKEIEDEGRRRGRLKHDANRSLCQKVGQMSRVFQAALRVGNA